MFLLLIDSVLVIAAVVLFAERLFLRHGMMEDPREREMKELAQEGDERAKTSGQE